MSARMTSSRRRERPSPYLKPQRRCSRAHLSLPWWPSPRITGQLRGAPSSPTKPRCGDNTWWTATRSWKGATPSATARPTILNLPRMGQSKARFPRRGSSQQNYDAGPHARGTARSMIANLDAPGSGPIRPTSHQRILSASRRGRRPEPHNAGRAAAMSPKCRTNISSGKLRSGR